MKKVVFKRAALECRVTKCEYFKSEVETPAAENLNPNGYSDGGKALKDEIEILLCCLLQRPSLELLSSHRWLNAEAVSVFNLQNLFSISLQY